MRYRILLAIAIANLFSAQLFSQVVDPAFQVVVTDKGTGRPLAYVNVCWESVDGKTVGHTVTDQKGIGKVRGGNGQMSVAISCVGYKTFRDTLEFVPRLEIALSEDIFNLEQITVTGTRTPRSLKESPVLTQLVTQRDIRVGASSTVTDVLAAEIPSIVINQVGYGSTITSQGLEGRYTLVLIDGERMAGETDGNVDFSRINVASIEQVEIVRGASSALYGSNAMGGVINIITKKPAQPLEGSLSLRYGQPNQRNASRNRVNAYDEAYRRNYLRNQDWHNINGDLSLGYRRNNFYTNTTFGFKSYDGYVLDSRKAEERYYPTLDSVALVNVGGSSSNSFVDFTVTNKTGFTGKRWSGEAHLSYYRHEEFDFTPDGAHNLYRDYTLGGFAERKFGDSSLIRISYNRDAYDKFDVKEQEDVQWMTYRQAYNHAKVIFSRRIGQRHSVLGGVEFLHEQLETTKFRQEDTLAAKSTSDAVFLLQDELSAWSGFSVIAGVRGGYNSSFGEHISPSLAVKLAHNDFSYRLSYARGFRAPSLKELYMSWDHMGMFTLQGSDNLRPETNNYYAFSMDYTSTPAMLSATVIAAYNQIYDKIGLVWSNNQTVCQYVNFENVRLWNAELLLKWRPVRPIQLKGGYVYTKVADSDNLVQQTSVTPHALIVQLEYSLKRERYELTANLSGKITGAKEVSVLDENVKAYYTVSYPAYSLWDFTLSQRFGDSFSLTTGIKNLLDYTAPIVTFNTTSTVGRRFFVAVGYNF